MTDQEQRTNPPGRDEPRPPDPDHHGPPSGIQPAQDPRPGDGSPSERRALDSREALAQHMLDGERRGRRFPRRLRRAARAVLPHDRESGGRDE
jgi:hypothetical protein